MKLKEICDIRKIDKKQKVSANRVHQIFLDTIVPDHWDKKLVVAVPKIKSLLSVTPRNMEEAITHHNIDADDVLEAATQLVGNKCELTATYILDTELVWVYDK